MTNDCTEMTRAVGEWVQTLVDESKEAGRRAGLEAAARECDSIADDWFQAPKDSESVLVACQVAGDCAEAIRERIGQPQASQLHDVRCCSCAEPVSCPRGHRDGLMDVGRSGQGGTDEPKIG